MGCTDDCQGLPCPSEGTGTISSVCGCSQACNCTPATPTPFYSQAQGCEESHKQVIIQNQYVTGLTTSVATNMPACNQTAILTFPGLQLISIGAYLWNPTFGYLKVTSFDYASSSVIVENECQDGNAAPGTAIPACTVFTVVDTPAGIDNPCTNAPVLQGSLVVCKGGVMQPLDATAANQVPMSVDAGSNEVVFQTVDVPVLECTALAADVTLIPGNVGPYAITVDDTTNFVAGEIIQFGALSYRLVLNTVPDGIHMTATIINGAPAGFVLVPTDTPVCHASCCEQLEYLFSKPCDWDLSDAYTSKDANGTTGSEHHGEVLDIGEGEANSLLSLTVTNPTCNKMRVMIGFEWTMTVGFIANNGEYADVDFKPQLAYVFGAIGTTSAPATAIWRDDYRHEAFHKAGTAQSPILDSYVHSTTLVLYVNAGQEVTFSTQAVFNLYAGSAGVQAEIEYMETRYCVLGVVL